MNKSFLFLSLFLVSLHSYAYIGPGMGGGVIAAVIGFFAAILLGYGVLYYPIKRALKKRKDKKMSLKESDNES